MFWGLVVEPGKRYMQTVGKSFHLSMASLELNNNDNDTVSLMLDYEAQEYVLCNLHRHKVMQCQLDLNFQFGEKIAFYSAGKSRVHLSGYLVNEDDIELSDEEEDEEDEEAAVQSPQKKRKEVSSNLTGIKKLKLNIPEVYEEDDKEMLKDNYNEEDSDEQQESVKNLNKFQENKMPGGKPKKQEISGQTPKASNQQNGQEHTPKLGKRKKNNQAGDTPKSDSAASTPQKKVLQGGVVVQDVKVGNGQVAKPGKQVSVYYIGRLKQNNKQFDASTSGPGFKFTLSRGEVIKGWDIGIAGMQVGGKRTIIVPPQMAYGKKGMPPAIPSNSVLVFDVELRNIN